MSYRDAFRTNADVRTATQLERQGTEVVFDAARVPPGLLGMTSRVGNRVRVFLGNHGSVDEVVQTLVHESAHARSVSKGRGFGTLGDEVQAAQREFLYTEGRRPTLAERQVIREQAQQAYPELVTGPGAAEARKKS